LESCYKVAKRLEKPQLATKFFDYIWKGWLNLATPVLSNTGTDRGLPILVLVLMWVIPSLILVTKNLELMLLAKHGGGVGIGIKYD
jgi:ribonucleoside-diphosphate reductase alpha chain